MSGSERRIDRSAEAKVRPALALVCTWLMPGEAVLDRVLDRDDVDLGPADDVQRRVERGRLAGAGRAGDQDHPVGLGEARASSARSCPSEKPRSVRSRRAVELSRMRMTTFSPHTVGRVATRRSILLAVGVDREAAVLRDAPLGDVDVGHDLEPADDAGLDRLGRAHDLVQHAVDAEAHPQVVLGRLEVDVRRAVLDRLRDQQVDVLDDRRVLDDLLDLGEVVLLLARRPGRWTGRRGRSRRGSTGRSPRRCRPGWRPPA